MTTKTVEELGQAWETYKALNDAALAEAKKHGEASAEAKVAADRANAAITAVQEKVASVEAQRAADRAVIDELETRMNRPAAGGRGMRLSDERIERYAAWQSHVQRKKVDPAHVDMELVGNYQRAYDDYLRHGKDFAQPESMRVLNAAVEGDNPSGGYYVEPDTGGRLVQFLYETSPVRRLASVQVASGDRLTGRVRLGQAGYAWVGETQARTVTTTPSVFEWEIPKREVYAEPDATQTLLDDASVDVAAWLEGEVRKVFALAEATAFVTGNTPRQPRGFTTYASGTPGTTAATWPVIEQVVSGSATTVTADGIQALIGSLKPFYLPNARFGMRRATETTVRQLKDGEGNYLWQPDFSAPAKSTLAGYPVELMADMAAIAGSALPIAFADFQEAYQIVDDPAGVRVLVDPYTNKPYVNFYTTRRVGGDVVNFDAIKLQVVSA